jgi:hypothetical protein
MSTRVIVTGSRHWRDASAIEQRLELALAKYRIFGPLVVVHGDHWDGADRITKNWALRNRHRGVINDPHPAEWKRLGKAAGPIRNQVMVDRGARECLAFPIGTEWSGTRDCMERAELAKIPVDDCGIAS